MSAEYREVFGISPLPAEDKRHAFVKVIGEVIDGRIVHLADARAAFPTEGEVFAVEKHLAPDGVGAIWRVQRTRTATHSKRESEYSAISRGQAFPHEIIAIAPGSDAPDAVREHLLYGQDVGYVPASSILVRLGDGVVIGPIRCAPLDLPDAFGFRCRADAFNEPLECWHDDASLSPFSFMDERIQRRFAGCLVLPTPQTYFDCAPLDHAVRATLKTLRENDALLATVSKRQMDALAREIAALNPSAKTEQRIRRVTNAVSDRVLSEATLDALRQHLATEKAVEQELAKLREQARADAKATLVQEQKGLASQVKELKGQRTRLASELVTLQAEAAKAEADAHATIARVAEQLRKKYAEIAEDPALHLSEVAMLRPFLVPAPRAAHVSEPAQARAAESSVEALAIEAEPVPMDSPSLLLNAIAQSLTAAGLTAGSAARVGREVFAAAVSGQITVFSGSLANELARAAAAAFSGGRAHEYRVPVGLFDCTYVTEQFRRLRASSENNGVLVTLVLEGMNRSAIEAYAEEIRSHVAARQCGGLSSTQSIVVIGTLSRGPSALEPAPWLCELGPAIDTDCLGLSTKPPPARVAGAVALTSWHEWQTQAPVAELPATLDDLLNAMEGERSVAWRRAVQNAYRQLASIDFPGSSSPLQSVAYAWLLPRAHLCGVPRQAFESVLREVTSTSEKSDPRVERLLERLYPQSDRA